MGKLLPLVKWEGQTKGVGRQKMSKNTHSPSRLCNCFEGEKEDGSLEVLEGMFRVGWKKRPGSWEGYQSKRYGFKSHLILFNFLKDLIYF